MRLWTQNAITTKMGNYIKVTMTLTHIMTLCSHSRIDVNIATAIVNERNKILYFILISFKNIQIKFIMMMVGAIRHTAHTLTNFQYFSSFFFFFDFLFRSLMDRSSEKWQYEKYGNQLFIYKSRAGMQSFFIFIF